MNDLKASEEFKNLYNIMVELRGEHGCEWDKKQSPESIKNNLVEEAYELIDAINNNDIDNIREEIGDVYLVITMLAYIFEQEGRFSVADSLHDVNHKLISRHPHVFGDVKASTAEESLAVWQQQKLKEGKSAPSYLERVGRGLPPLEKAVKLEKKLVKAGYSFKSNINACLEKVDEELNELKAEINVADHEKTIDELGDVFLTLVILSEHLGIDPSEAINRANNKVIGRFAFVEQELKQQGLEIDKAHYEKMEEAWQKAKKNGL